MELQLEQETRARLKLEEKKKFLTDIISAAARYERILVTKDFQDILKDLQNVVDLHEQEIKGYLSAFSMSSSFFKRMRLMDVIAQHQLKKEQINDAIHYPQLIVEKANIAREELARMKEQELKETTNV